MPLHPTVEHLIRRVEALSGKPVHVGEALFQIDSNVIGHLQEGECGHGFREPRQHIPNRNPQVGGHRRRAKAGSIKPGLLGPARQFVERGTSFRIPDSLKKAMMGG